MATKPSRIDGFLRGGAVAILSALLFVQLNFLASRHYRRFDWTSTRAFTLSSRSREVARALRGRTEIYVLMGRDEPLYADAAELAERYASESSRVELHTIDPDRQRERFIALAQRLDLQVVESRSADRTLSTAGIVVVRGNRHWEVSREQLRELGQGGDGGEDQSAQRLLNARITVERAVTEALLQVDRDRSTKVCFSTGHAEMPIASGDRSGQGLVDDLRHHNFQVVEAEVRGQTGVPPDCDALLIAGAQRGWSAEDSEAVERYLRAGGNVGIFADLTVLEGRVIPTGLEGVAALAGIAMPSAVTVEADADHLMSGAPPVHFRADSWNEHELTRDLRGSSIIAALVRPLRRAPGSSVVPSALVQSSAHAWGETSIAELFRTFSPSRERGDIEGPIALAMASEFPGARRRGEGLSSGRVVVVGTSAVVEAPYFTLTARSTVANADFAEAIVGWLTARRELVNIPSRPAQRASLLVSERDLTQLGLYVVLLIPLAVGLVGLAVWRARKQAP